MACQTKAGEEHDTAKEEAQEERDIEKVEAQEVAYHRWKHCSHIPLAGREDEAGRAESRAGQLRFRVRQIGLRGCQRRT